ncbi:unnamed protein product [Rangifer tarandus platyrhynchus]|uniref:Uncharacterized protein n=1 Tax=Rangifer tarandus platyrhynchus TaxID=3082113 RepID=A0ABN8XLI9_RANTA|nr:unnamed protein product [Rangifer tarandus platyrhynchus]
MPLNTTSGRDSPASLAFPELENAVSARDREAQASTNVRVWVVDRSEHTAEVRHKDSAYNRRHPDRESCQCLLTWDCKMCAEDVASSYVGGCCGGKFDRQRTSVYAMVCAMETAYRRPSTEPSAAIVTASGQPSAVTDGIPGEAARHIAESSADWQAGGEPLLPIRKVYERPEVLERVGGDYPTRRTQQNGGVPSEAHTFPRAALFALFLEVAYKRTFGYDPDVGSA